MCTTNVLQEYIYIQLHSHPWIASVLRLPDLRRHSARYKEGGAVRSRIPREYRRLQDCFRLRSLQWYFPTQRGLRTPRLFVEGTQPAETIHLGSKALVSHLITLRDVQSTTTVLLMPLAGCIFAGATVSYYLSRETARGLCCSS